MLEAKKFYATLASNHGGPGCVEIHAETKDQATTQMWTIFNNRYAFMYESLESVHPLDRKIMLYIKNSIVQFNPFED
jgi:hypothetical protein